MGPPIWSLGAQLRIFKGDCRRLPLAWMFSNDGCFLWNPQPIASVTGVSFFRVPNVILPVNILMCCRSRIIRELQTLSW
jgi:hypothetical protein